MSSYLYIGGCNDGVWMEMSRTPEVVEIIDSASTLRHQYHRRVVVRKTDSGVEKFIVYAVSGVDEKEALRQLNEQLRVKRDTQKP